MKKILPDKSSNLDSINQVKCDGQAITDKESIANQFCKYFSEIKLRISDRFKRSSVAWPICFRSFFDKFYMAPVTNGFVCKQLLQLRATKATGLDGLPSRLLKDSAVPISVLITHVINLSITTQSVYTS